MKKIILITVIFINILCGSQYTLDNIPEFNNRVEAMDWVHNEITWEARDNLLFVQSPAKTLRQRTGVCQDKSVLLMYIFKHQFNDNPEFVSIATDQSSTPHAIVLVDGRLYDPTSNQSPIETYEIIFTYYILDYNSTIAWANMNN